MERSHYMTDEQKAKWAAAEEKAGHKIKRFHSNCLRILGVRRPGKTAQDRAK